MLKILGVFSRYLNIILPPNAAVARIHSAAKGICIEVRTGPCRVMVFRCRMSVVAFRLSELPLRFDWLPPPERATPVRFESVERSARWLVLDSQDRSGSCTDFIKDEVDGI